MLERFALGCLTAALACFGLAFAVSSPSQTGAGNPPRKPAVIRPATPEEELRWQLEHARDLRRAGVDEGQIIK